MDCLKYLSSADLGEVRSFFSEQNSPIQKSIKLGTCHLNNAQNVTIFVVSTVKQNYLNKHVLFWTSNVWNNLLESCFLWLNTPNVSIWNGQILFRKHGTPTSLLWAWNTLKALSWTHFAWLFRRIEVSIFTRDTGFYQRFLFLFFL